MATKVLQLSAIDITIYKFVLPLMERLREEGFEVFFACNDLGYKVNIEERGFTGFKIDIQRNINPFSAITSIWQLYKILRKEKVDIIHVHTPIAAIIGRIAAKLAGTRRVIYTVHGFYVSNRFFYTLEKLFCKYFTDFIFTVSDEDKEFALKEGFILKDNISSINSVGIDTERFNPSAVKAIDKADARKFVGVSEDDIVIGFIGRIVREKGVLDLYDAFRDIAKDINNAKLVLIGPWDLGERDTRTKEMLDENIAQDGMENRVVITGQREDIPEMLSILDIFVLPSYREGMPVSLLEAMAMELPVIATAIRGCREELDESSGILYEPGNIEALRNALTYLIEHKEKAREMGINARNRVIDLFEQQKCIERQLKVYEKVIR